MSALYSTNNQRRMAGHDLLDLPAPLLEPSDGSTTRSPSQFYSARPSRQRREQLEDEDAAKPGSVTTDVAARMTAPRLTRLCEFEDKQLEAEYKSYAARQRLGSRTAPIACATALVIFACAAVNWAVGADNFMPLFALAYAGCWLAFAGYARLAVSRGVLTAKADAFAALYICTHIPIMLLFGGLRETPTIGRSAISEYQLFIASLAAAYAQLDVRHCAVIACAGTLGVTINTALLLARDIPLLSCSALGRIEIIERIFGALFHGLLEAVMVFVSVSINTAMRTAYQSYRAIDANASQRELAAAERERMLQHEAKVELKLRTAEAAKNARSSLIRMVGPIVLPRVMHDLRSPLLSVANAVAIVLDMMPHTRVDDSVVVECLRAMATCSQLMQHIVSDMLDFERIDSGRLVLVPAAMRISQLLEAAADAFGGLAAVKGVTLRLVPLLPDLERAVFIGDMRRLQQCVNNGVSNSIKFTEAGGTVTIRARRGDDTQAQAEPHASSAAAAAPAAAAVPYASIVLEVGDSGAGLTTDELYVLNQGEAFMQVGQGQLQGSGGTGLGLTIVRELLKLHGGSRMRLESVGHRHGSTFRLELALAEAPEGSFVLGDVSPGLAKRLFLAQSHPNSQASTETTPIVNERRDNPKYNHGKTPGGAMTLAAAVLLPTRSTSGSTAAVAGTLGEGIPGGGASRALDAAKSKSQARPQLCFPPDFRMLHVEDDALLRRSFELRVVKKLGVPYDVAVNGAEAVRLILEEKRKYALVLMDNQMPVLTGEIATRTLRAGGFEGVIVGMTGDPHGCFERDEFEAAGLNLCVDKDSPGVHKFIQVLGSFALDEEEPGAGSSSSPPGLPVDQASPSE
ncbi:hypothetical protein T492DRAFT_1144142 [Pavlovales sp. CCMP2436]|nr:hypothetical protein T492DRAFT_1144142 [Pavlovales sp. CCMP2436]